MADERQQRMFGNGPKGQVPQPGQFPLEQGQVPQPGQFPLEQGQVFECECGEKEFVNEPRQLIIYNRLRHNQVCLTEIVRIKCTKCGTLFAMDKAGGERIDKHAAKKQEQARSGGDNAKA